MPIISTTVDIGKVDADVEVSNRDLVETFFYEMGTDNQLRAHAIKALEVDVDFIKNTLPVVADKLRKDGDAATAMRIDELVRGLT